MTDGRDRLGFMQGRLSPQVDGKIQAFPSDHWRDEFPIAARLGISLMEWTLDQERLFENPLMTVGGRREIQALCLAHGIRVKSLTGDFLMQAPFWKINGDARARLLSELDAVLDACAELGIKVLVIPLVDNGRLETPSQASILAEALQRRSDSLRARGMTIAFESDFMPDRLAAFIDGYPSHSFGINYDIGNSASLGYDCGEEFGAFASRIRHVHVKDRLLGGTTVPLGTGAADLPRAISLLEQNGYRGDYILQTARSVEQDHAGVLTRYRDMTLGWIAGHRSWTSA